MCDLYMHVHVAVIFLLKIQVVVTVLYQDSKPLHNGRQTTLSISCFAC